MKKIGVVLRKNKSISNRNIYSIDKDLIQFLNKYNNILVIPFYLYDDFNKTKIYIDECDGVVLSGGNNLDTKIYEIIDYLYKKDIPTLGICLGMQEMGCYFDGKLDNLKSNNHYIDKNYVHEVIIDPESILYKIFNKNIIKVNSRHHDYLLYTNANRTAWSNDYIIEAIEIRDKKFFIGVQWHPESLYFDINSNRLFNYFINSLK